MRLVFIVLLLVNLVLLVWGQGLVGGQEAGREPERLKQQIDPDRLHIVRGEAEPAPPPPPPPPVVEPPACKRIEGLAGAQVETVKKALADDARWEVRDFPLPGATAHWVVIPDLPSRVMAEKKRAELRQLGVNEGQVVENATLGPFAVSLGIFRSEQLAQDYLQSVGRKGVRSAKLAKHELPADRFALELRAPAAELARRLPDLLVPLAQVSVADCAAP
jgi:hypothetical protein